MAEYWGKIIDVPSVERAFFIPVVDGKAQNRHVSFLIEVPTGFHRTAANPKIFLEIHDHHARRRGGIIYRPIVKLMLLLFEEGMLLIASHFFSEQSNMMRGRGRTR